MAVDRTGELVARWRGGDQEAAAELFRRYAGRLVALARSHLSSKLSRRVDAEDVVQSVYRSFFARARDGQYSIQPGGDLWQLLAAITLNKLHDQVRRNSRAKRSVHREQNFGSEESLGAIQPQALAADPPLEEALALADELEQFMVRLEPLHRRMLELRLQGYNLDEIAADIQRSERTVIRVLNRIKDDLQHWHEAQTGG